MQYKLKISFGLFCPKFFPSVNGQLLVASYLISHFTYIFLLRCCRLSDFAPSHAADASSNGNFNLWQTRIIIRIATWPLAELITAAPQLSKGDRSTYRSPSTAFVLISSRRVSCFLYISNPPYAADPAD